jgi:protein-L-isoaspartate(D-aspartate) O-methyltransferase
MDQARRVMVQEQLRNRGITDERVLKAMEVIPRHQFVSEEQRDFAYEDGPLPIGKAQTISQPYIVAFMTEVLQVQGDHTVLEVGTGSGYQAAILSLLATRVISLEIVEELGYTAAQRLAKLGYTNVEVHITDGKKGWPEHAPYDRILVTAAPRKVPEALIHQLSPGGRMVIPVGKTLFNQSLEIITKTESGDVEIQPSLPVRFVPLV